MRQDSDWQCPKCKKWRKTTTEICPCGHIPRIRITRLARECKKTYLYIDNTLRKYGLM